MTSLCGSYLASKSGVDKSKPLDRPAFVQDTIIVRVQTCICPSEAVPIRLISYAPARTLGPTVTVTVEVAESPCEGVRSVGEKLRSRPVGAPVQDKFTVDEKLLIGLTVIVAFHESP